jgi:energy-coupling factor transporter transmembrane protein EcfT
VLLARSLQLSSETHLAMQSRGFAGEVYVLDDLRVKARGWIALAVFLGLAAAALWWGR